MLRLDMCLRKEKFDFPNRIFSAALVRPASGGRTIASVRRVNADTVVQHILRTVTVFRQYHHYHHPGIIPRHSLVKIHKFPYLYIEKFYLPFFFIIAKIMKFGNIGTFYAFLTRGLYETRRYP